MHMVFLNMIQACEFGLEAIVLEVWAKISIIAKVSSEHGNHFCLATKNNLRQVLGKDFEKNTVFRMWFAIFCFFCSLLKCRRGFGFYYYSKSMKYNMSR